MALPSPEPGPPKPSSAVTAVEAPPSVLVVDDDTEVGEMVVTFLRRKKYLALYVSSAEDALVVLSEKAFDLVLTDIEMGPMDGVALCKHIVAADSELPVIVLTGQTRTHASARALGAGAFEFLLKPVDCDVLDLSIQRALVHRNAMIQGRSPVKPSPV